MMQEVLSKPAYEILPHSEQELYELRIDDSCDSSLSSFTVTQTRVSWSESDKRFTWESPEVERCPTLPMAQECYEARLQALRAQGFTQSDMDLF
jgi:hypothetical protein